MAGDWAVIFDVDGTLVDSERDGHRVAFNRAFAGAGLSYSWDEATYGGLLRTTGGRSRIAGYLEAESVGTAEAAALATRLHRVKTEIFVAMVRDGQVEPRPGVRRLLDRLTAAGARLGIATTGSPEWVEALLATRFAAVPFEVVVTRREAPALKPEPDAYLVALRLLGIEARAAVAVEDSRNGLLAASRAGLPCAVVTNAYTVDQSFEGAGLVLDGFEGLEIETLRMLTSGRKPEA